MKSYQLNGNEKTGMVTDDVLVGEMSHQDIVLCKWLLAAALDDPTVCDEMKADIRAWYDQFNREFVIGEIEAI